MNTFSCFTPKMTDFDDGQKWEYFLAIVRTNGEISKIFFKCFMFFMTLGNRYVLLLILRQTS